MSKKVLTGQLVLAQPEALRSHALYLRSKEVFFRLQYTRVYHCFVRKNALVSNRTACVCVCAMGTHRVSRFAAPGLVGQAKPRSRRSCSRRFHAAPLCCDRASTGVRSTLVRGRARNARESTSIAGVRGGTKTTAHTRQIKQCSSGGVGQTRAHEAGFEPLSGNT